jgi:hypothetical protein
MAGGNTVSSKLPDQPMSIRLRNPWLAMARLVWLIFAPINIIVCLLSLPLYIRQPEFILTSGILDQWTKHSLNSALTELNFSSGFLIAFLNLRGLILLFFFIAVGFLIFWKKSDELLGLFVSYMLVGLSGTFFGINSLLLDTLPDSWRMVITTAGVFIWPSFFIFLFLFPNGQFVPRWTRWFVPFWIVYTLVIQFLFDSRGPTPVTLILFGFLSIGITIFSQFYRYLRVSNHIERLQAKWFLYFLVVFFISIMISNIFPSLFPSLVQTPGQKLISNIISRLISDLSFLLLIASIGIALFRYHLWNIDVIIRRTLIYSTVTAILAGIYFAGVILLQRLFQVITGQNQSPIAIVVSTLLIAAMFSPLRRRIQANIDRRFYRQKYNAQKMLQSFASTVRNEVELEQLTTHFMTVVDDTLQPENMSLWLR